MAGDTRSWRALLGSCARNSFHGEQPARRPGMRQVPVVLLALVWFAGGSVAVSAETYTVDTTVDELDGSCLDDCSLRDALALANAGPDEDEIVLGAEAYQLTLIGAGDDAGDLDVFHPLLLRGVDSEQTVVEQTVAGERVFDLADSGRARLEDLRVTGGDLGFGDAGAGIRAQSDLTLVAVAVDGNQVGSTGSPSGFGGGLRMGSGVEAEIRDSRFVGNAAEFGFQIHSEGSSLLTLHATSVESGFGSGAVIVDIDTVEIEGSTLSGGNQGSLFVALESGNQLTVRNSTFRAPVLISSFAGGASAHIEHSTIVTPTGTSLPVLGISQVATEIRSTVIDGGCDPFTAANVTSLGDNVQTVTSTNACFVPGSSDQVDVAPVDLHLGPLGDHGGLTDTYAIVDPSSVLLGPALIGCGQTVDQRGAPRNSCDVGAFEREATCFAPDIPLPIPDDDAVGVTFPLPATTLGTDVDVFVDIEHSSVGDLSVLLEGPLGQSVTLLDQPLGGGCAGEDVLTVFDDEASRDSDSDCRSVPGLEALPRARYRAADALQALEGVSGSWTVSVADHASGDLGSVRRVCLATTVSQLFADGFESGDTAAWTVPE